MKKIPSVDLSHFVIGSIEEKETFIKALGNAFETIGFVALKGHGLSRVMQQALYEQVSRFFSLPQASKNQYIMMAILVIVMGIGGYFMYQQDKANPAADTSKVLEFKAEDVDFWK